MFETLFMHSNSDETKDNKVYPDVRRRKDMKSDSMVREETHGDLRRKKA